MTRHELSIALFKSAKKTMLSRLPLNDEYLWAAVVEELDAYFASIDDDCLPACFNDVEAGAVNIIQQYADSER